VNAPITGTCEARFTAVREAFARNFAERGEVGAGLCVIVGGRVVGILSAVGLNEAGERPLAPDTLVNFYSVGKPLIALLAFAVRRCRPHRLDDPIVSVWPEFGVGGKSGATVRQALCHRAGVPAIREPLTNRDLWDWERMAEALGATAACGNLEPVMLPYEHLPGH